MHAVTPMTQCLWGKRYTRDIYIAVWVTNTEQITTTSSASCSQPQRAGSACGPGPSPHLIFATQVMSWNAHRIDEAITEVHMLLKDANQVLAVLKQNEAQSRTTIANWAAPQPFDRKEGKVCALSSLPHTLLTTDMCWQHVSAQCLPTCAVFLPHPHLSRMHDLACLASAPPGTAALLQASPQLHTHQCTTH